MSGKFPWRYTWSQWALPFTLAALMVAFSLTTPYFLTGQNMGNILVASSTLVILAVGAALVMGAGGIDLSIGAIMAFATSAACVLMIIPDLGGPATIAVCLIAGLVLGAMNGTLAAYTVLPAFIITLAVMSIARGAAYLMMGGQLHYGLPPEIIWVGQGTVFGIPVPIILALGIAVLFHVLLTQTALGRHVIAYGDNPTATYAMGVNIPALKIKLYALSGFTGAVAGLIYAGRLNTIDPSAGLMVELAAITAAIIGGAKLAGGRTSVIGAVLGAVLMGVLQNGLNLQAMSGFYQYIAVGVVLLAAVLIQPREKS